MNILTMCPYKFTEKGKLNKYIAAVPEKEKAL